MLALLDRGHLPPRHTNDWCGVGLAACRTLVADFCLADLGRCGWDICRADLCRFLRLPPAADFGSRTLLRCVLMMDEKYSERVLQFTMVAKMYPYLCCHFGFCSFLWPAPPHLGLASLLAGTWWLDYVGRSWQMRLVHLSEQIFSDFPSCPRQQTRLSRTLLRCVLMEEKYSESSAVHIGCQDNYL